MSVFQILWSEAENANTPWLLLAVSVLAVAQAFAAQRTRFKALVFFVITHLVALLVTAGLVASASSLDATLRMISWVFGAVAFVDAAAGLLFTVILPRLRLAMPRILQDVLVALVSVVAAVGTASRAGVNLSGLIATSAVLTAVLGFSLQDVIGNIAGGLALQLDTSLEVGDWIKVNDISGQVTEIHWRHTAIETRNWETVLVPNSLLMKSTVVLQGKRRNAPRQLRRWVYFSVDWRHSPSDVIDTVLSAVRGVPIERVAETPAPNCVLMDMSESLGHYAVRYWLTDIAVDDPTDSELRTRIYFALQRAGISPPMPAHAVFLTEQSSDRQVMKREREVERRSDLLDSIGLFAALSQDERAELATQLVYAPFARDEVMTKQGAEAHWLYLITEGTAKVIVADGEREREVAKLKAGDFFGEMSLLTGETRSATVVAQTDVECFRLERAAFQRVIERRPELAKDLAALLSKRRIELEAAKRGLDAEGARLRLETEERRLLDRIRGFFNLS